MVAGDVAGIHEVVTGARNDALAVIQQGVAEHVDGPDRANVQALIVEELRRLHEGVMARYGLRPAQLDAWKAPRAAGQSD